MESNAIQSIDLLMETLNLIFSKWLHYYRERQEVSIVQSALDAVSEHVNNVAYEFNPLEHTLYTLAKQVINGERIDLDFVMLSDKFANSKDGEVLISKAIFREFNNKKCDLSDLNKLLNILGEDITIKNYLLSDLKNPKLIENDYGKAFADAYLSGKLSLNDNNLIRLGYLSDKTRIEVVDRILSFDTTREVDTDLNTFVNDLLDNYQVNSSEMLVDGNTSNFISVFKKEFKSQIRDFLVVNKMPSLESDSNGDLILTKNIEFIRKGFKPAFFDKVDDQAFKAHFEKQFLYDENGNVLSPEERNEKADALQTIMSKQFNELTVADRKAMGYSALTQLGNSPLKHLCNQLSDSVILNSMSKLRSIKHSTLEKRFTGTQYNVKKDVDERVSVHGMLKDDESKFGLGSKERDMIGKIVTNTLYEAEKKVVEQAKKDVNLDQLRGVDLIQTVKALGMKGEIKYPNKEMFSQALKGISNGLKSCDLGKIMIGFEDETDKKWYTPLKMVDSNDLETAINMKNAFQNSNSSYMNNVWSININDFSKAPESTKNQFLMDRDFSTLEYLDERFNSYKLKEPTVYSDFTALYNQTTNADLRQLLIGYGLNIIDITKDNLSPFGKALIDLGYDMKDWTDALPKEHFINVFNEADKNRFAFMEATRDQNFTL